MASARVRRRTLRALAAVLVLAGAIVGVRALLPRDEPAPELGPAPVGSRPAAWSFAGTLDGGRTLVLRVRVSWGGCQRLEPMPPTESADQVRTAVNVVDPPRDEDITCAADLRGGGFVEIPLKRPLAGRTVTGPLVECEPYASVPADPDQRDVTFCPR